ncbi:MAG: hypothetical protein AAF612_12140, partial [Planctomycetota bacterium]
NLRWALAIFTLVWFGAVLPGHERGAIRVPGSSVVNGQADPARADPNNAADASPSGALVACPACKLNQSSEPSENEDPSDNPAPCGGLCALCQLIATLDTPLPVDLTWAIHRAGPLQKQPAPARIAANHTPGVPPARGPPRPLA